MSVRLTLDIDDDMAAALDAMAADMKLTFTRDIAAAAALWSGPERVEFGGT